MLFSGFSSVTGTTRSSTSSRSSTFRYFDSPVCLTFSAAAISPLLRLPAATAFKMEK